MRMQYRIQHNLKSLYLSGGAGGTMKIAIVDMGLDTNDRFGHTERNICELSRSLVKDGHEVMVLYRNHIQGDYMFPLDEQVKRQRISIDSVELSGAEKMRREFLRVFSPAKARKMTGAYRRRAYAAAISRELNVFMPDMVIFDSSVDASLISALKVPGMILFLDKVCAGSCGADECGRENKDSVIYHIFKEIDKLQNTLAGNTRIHEPVLAHVS